MSLSQNNSVDVEGFMIIELRRIGITATPWERMIFMWLWKRIDKLDFYNTKRGKKPFMSIVKGYIKT